jgi:ribonucleoside-diphosphate reductase alpha chain
MSNGIYIVKRNGNKEPINIDKIHKVVEHACFGLAGVSSSQIEMNANLQFYDGMTTQEIQEILVRSANDLISLDSPNYQYAAARLLSYGVNKEVFGDYAAITLNTMIKLNIGRGVYDPEILNKYSEDEIDRLDSYINHKRDENFTYAGLRQVVDKYLCQDRSSGQVFETPQFMYMMIAATLFAEYPKETRMQYVRRYYDATSLFKVNIPTPVMSGVRTPVRQFASCVLVDSDDTLDSIFASDMAIGRYTSQRAGIGINAGRIRGVNERLEAAK